MQVQNWTMPMKNKNKAFYKHDKKRLTAKFLKYRSCHRGACDTAPAPRGAVYEKIHSWVQTIFS